MLVVKRMNTNVIIGQFLEPIGARVWDIRGGWSRADGELQRLNFSIHIT